MENYGITADQEIDHMLDMMTLIKLSHDNEGLIPQSTFDYAVQQILKWAFQTDHDFEVMINKSLMSPLLPPDTSKERMKYLSGD